MFPGFLLSHVSLGWATAPLVLIRTLLKPRALLACAALLAVACAPRLAAAEVDDDGVAMMFPAKPGGTQFRLGTRDPRRPARDRDRQSFWVSI